MDNTSEPKSQAFDPGWNDPPKFSYNTQTTTPSRPRNYLNKRVAFPLSNASPGQPTPMSLPPMPGIPTLPTMPPTLPSTIPAEPINNQEPVLDDQNTLKEVKDILLHFLGNSSELGPKSNDIKRRIGVMEDMWLRGKLNASIHQQMKELAYAIRDDLPTKADDIHKALMVDHVSSVGAWMPGVKQLIHHCIARSELMSIENEDAAEDS